MRIITILLFLSINATVLATNYYVSNTGNNAADGKSPATAWQTIGKVNAEMPNFKPGDNILLRRGDTFDDATLVIEKSGIEGRPITFGAYGEGDKPMFTSFTELTTWNNEGNGIYSTSLSIESGSIPDDYNFIRIMLTIDGNVHWMGRWPNKGYRNIDTVIGDNKFTDNKLTGNPNYKGAEVVVRVQPWSTDRRRITDHKGGTITLRSINDGSTALNENYGYYFQNHIDFLDEFGDWYYDTGDSKLYVYFGENPGSFTVKAATRNSLIDITGNDNYVTIENLSLHGSNLNSLQRRLFSAGSTHLTFRNLDIDYSGKNGMALWNVHYSTITNNTIKNSMGDGLRARGGSGCNHNTITHNVIINSGLIPGTDNTGFSGIEWRGTYNLFQYNHILYSGQNGIRCANPSTGTEIKNNFINYFGLTVDDLGGIYISGAWADRVIHGNIILNGIGNYEGTPNDLSQAIGIYNDHSSDGSAGITVENNVIAYSGSSGYFMNGGTGLKISNNLMYANRRQALIIGRDEYVKTQNMIFANNILIGDDPTNPIMYTRSYYRNPDFYKEINNNYYLRAGNITTEMFQTREPNPVGTVYYDFNGWKKYNGGDANSNASVIDTSGIMFEYNAKLENRVIILDRPMIDVTGKKYINSITLLPYTAALLMVDPNPPTLYTLKINTNGNGYTNVNEVPEVKSIKLEANKPASIEAKPDPGWKFSHWTGDASGSANPMEIIMNDDKSITAVFIEESYTLTITLEGQGSIPVIPDQESYLKGTNVILKAQPSKGWIFSDWTGDVTGSVNQVEIIMDDDKIIGAVFLEEEDKYLIYPNPASEYLTIYFEEPTFEPGSFRIIDLHGKIVHEDFLVSGINEVQIPNHLPAAIYIIELILRGLPIYVQRLIITN